ncbi:Uncharacterized protein FWK35_00026937 [Aphis craccivora]|uniref:Uncharacterized protein n=1 Tax=Aphis craccivora TaxID=307492 RepID=A0A6G0Y667_APHCR|nr:Uncharacterized protein FWK35_00026937 [Aphis craccivora]
MSDGFVTFNIRYERSLIELKLKEPTEISRFVETLKNELKLEETDELVILCPTFEGKMMEIQSDDDIVFLKETKLSYNATTKEVYCNVELVVTIIQKLQDDPNSQIMILSKKFDNFTSKVDKLLDKFDSKIDENTTSILSTNRSISAEHLKIDSGNKLKSSLGEEDLKESKPNVENMLKKETKMDKKKLSSPTTLGSNNNSSTTFENLKSDTPKSAPRPVSIAFEVLLKMLEENGFTNKIQNIIVLKRFNNDYEKSINYLKLSYASNQL